MIFAPNLSNKLNLYSVELLEQLMKGSILIVDDVPDTRVMLRILLEMFGFEVFEAVDGEDALRKVSQELPDVVIMDVMMPNMDGITACKILRQQPQSSHLPIIMLSGKVQQDSMRDGLAAGANVYLPKPYDANLLISYIQALQAVTAPMPMVSA